MPENNPSVSSFANNRRSSSQLSEQNSKRSSISTSNLNVSLTNNDGEFIQNARKSTKENISDQNHRGRNKKQQKSSFQTASQQELFQKVKIQLTETYRVIKKHAKQSILMFTETQLKEVYRGMSNSLISLEKGLNLVNARKTEAHLSQVTFLKQQQQNRFNSSSKLAKSCSEAEDQLALKQGNSIINSFYSSVNQVSPNNMAVYLNKIQQLQHEIDQTRQKSSQQIRVMIQNHEEEMMFFQEEQTQKLNIVKKDFQNQIASLLQGHKKREQELKLQFSRKVNAQVSQKLQLLRHQQASKLDSFKKQSQQLQKNYKNLVKTLIDKLNQSKSLIDQLSAQFDQKKSYIKNFIQQLIAKNSNSNSGIQNFTEQFLKSLQEKIVSLSLVGKQKKSLINHRQNAHKSLIKLKMGQNQKRSPLPHCTMAIEQMFMKSDHQIDFHNDFQNSLEAMLQKLVWYGFFTEQNEDNILSLINIGRHKYNLNQCTNAQFEDSYPGNILSHTLYPLIIQKMKLTLSKFSGQNSPKKSQDPLVYNSNGLREDACTQFDRVKQLKDSISQFDVCAEGFKGQIMNRGGKGYQNSKRNGSNLIRYRNIESIQELQVSDSMIGDGEGSRLQMEDNYSKINTKQGRTEGNNNSPKINYNGHSSHEQIRAEGQNYSYEQSSSQSSRSFDIDGF